MVKKSKKRSRSRIRQIKPCRSGSIRNENTNRCRKISRRRSVTKKSRRSNVKKSIKRSRSKTRKPCPEGSIRNENTNRCRKINGNIKKRSRRSKRAYVRKPCPEGSFKHEVTGRCRKIPSRIVTKAEYKKELAKCDKALLDLRNLTIQYFESYMTEKLK